MNKWLVASRRYTVGITAMHVVDVAGVVFTEP